MLSAYTANLTANLTVQNLATPLRSLADLKRSGNLFGVPADSSVEAYFRDSKVRPASGARAFGLVHATAPAAQRACGLARGAARMQAAAGDRSGSRRAPLQALARARWQVRLRCPGRQ